MKIVAVDDSEALREFIAAVLESAGHTVLHAGDALAALAAVSAHSVDMVLSDVNMGAMDGFALAAALRAHPAHADIPIVFVTGEDTEDFKSRCRQSGVNGWLKKPFKPDQLLKLVRSFEF